MAWNVLYFLEDDGRSPAKEFLTAKKGVPKGLVNRLEAVLQRHIIPSGIRARGEYIHKVDEFYQIRFGDYRVLAYLPDDESDTLVLLNAFKKDANDTPPNQTVLLAETLKKKDQNERRKEREAKSKAVDKRR